MCAGRVPVPDQRFDFLCDYFKPPRYVFLTIVHSSVVVIFITFRLQCVNLIYDYCFMIVLVLAMFSAFVMLSSTLATDHLFLFSSVLCCHFHLPPAVLET